MLLMLLMVWIPFVFQTSRRQCFIHFRRNCQYLAPTELDMPPTKERILLGFSNHRRGRRHAVVHLRKLEVESQPWQVTVEELAGRGFSLRSLLRFYKRLGVDCMAHFDPTRHTTNDVVRQAIIPLSSSRKCAYAVIMMDAVPTRPKKMVTHNWGNLFADLVAAIVADALGENEYEYLVELLKDDVENLEDSF